MRRNDGLETTTADAQLLAQLRDLDSEALTLVYNQYHTSLYRYIAFRVEDAQTAEDLTSDVFTRLLTAIRKGRLPQSTLKGWLFSVANNIVTDHYRTKSRWQWTGLTDLLVSSAETLDQQISQIMNNEQLRTSLKKLTKAQQHVLALRFGYGMSIREVADLLGKNEGAVKMIQARAVAALTREMNE